MINRRGILYTEMRELPRHEDFDEEAEDYQSRISEIDLLIDIIREVEVDE